MGLVSNYLLAVLQKFSNGDASCYCSPICGYASCDSYLVYFCGLLTLSLSQYLLAKVMSVPEFFDFLTGLVSSAIGLLIGIAFGKKSKKSI